MADDPFLRQHDALLERVLAAMLDIVPEHWDTAVLAATQTARPPAYALTVTVRNSHGPGEGVAHSAALYAAVYELDQFCRAHDRSWRRAVLHAWRDGDDWAFQAEFGND